MGGSLSYEWFGESAVPAPPVFYGPLTWTDTMFGLPTNWGTSRQLTEMWRSGDQIKTPAAVTFLQPEGVAIADPESENVKIFDLQTGLTLSTIKGSVINEIVPTGIAAVDYPLPNLILVADKKNKKLQTYRNGPKSYAAVKSWEYKFSCPGQLTFSPASKQWLILDTEDCCVYVHDDRGQRVRSFGQGLLPEPAYITADIMGRVYVTDTQTESIVVFNSDGTHLYSFGAGDDTMHGPRGLVVDEKCNLYIADHYNDRIGVYSPDGRLRFHLSSNAGLRRPIALALHHDKGLLAVTSQYLGWTNLTVYKIH